MVHTTNHAKQRIKQRCGLGAKATDRIVEKVFKDGICHKDTTGRLNKWITNLYFQNQSANNIRIYGDKAYIFTNTTLITVLQVPANLTKDMKRMIKRKEDTHGGTDQNRVTAL